MCFENDCKKRAYYNIYGLKPLYCRQHKLTGMIDVKSKKCIYPNCKIQPVFNLKGLSPLYCYNHKLPVMVDVKSKRCIFENCEIRPIFNIKGLTPLYCLVHKVDGMVDVVSKKCIFENCEKISTYNFEGLKPLYCSAHKVNEMVDVVSKKCIFENCNTIPKYNIEGCKALYCSQHKKDKMIDVKNKTCIFKNCKKNPVYNIDGEIKRLYCSQHKKEGMIDVHNKTCKNDWCYTFIGNKYEGYCLFCYINMFPDKPVSRNYKTKEYAVVEYVKNKFPELTWITDKKISDGCSSRRPDLLLDLGYQVLIVEIDENQHADYDCSCENKRIMQLSQDVNHRPIVFIRFNPDEYIEKVYENLQTISSCWSINKKGICVVKRTKFDEWTNRLDVLTNQINYWINPDNKTVKTVEIIQLFYNKI